MRSMRSILLVYWCVTRILYYWSMWFNCFIAKSQLHRISSQHRKRKCRHCYCTHCDSLCHSFLQNQPPRPSSVCPPQFEHDNVSSHTSYFPSFDEVHFGKFASYYLRREYYFDVHPPLAKMLFGLAGWFVGYDGHFDFENIGDSYTENHVPYVGLRALPAILGSLTVPIVYAIMKETGHSTIIAAFSAILILFGKFTPSF